jgi:hypothetical protein
MNWLSNVEAKNHDRTFIPRKANWAKPLVSSQETIFNWHADAYLFLLDPLNIPPLNPPMPIRNPRLYQVSLLLTAYMVTSSLKSEIIKVSGAKNP